MVTVSLGVAMFTFVIVSLVGLLMVARRQLVATGEVTIGINGDADKALCTAAGGTLLGTLCDNRLFIPSACGGKGSCGVCKVTVLDGGGAVLPTERSHLSRGEERDGVRLSCQVKVKQDMAIELPAEVFDIRQWQCKVRSNHNVATFIKELILELPAGEEVPFRAGGYIQIEAPAGTYDFELFDVEEDYRADWDRFNLWRYTAVLDEPVTRAYSMANFPDGEGRHHAQHPDRLAAAAGAGGDAAGQDDQLHLQPEAGRRRHHLRPVRRVLRQGHPGGDDLRRRRGRHGADALAHLRPVPPPRDRPQGELLVRARAASARRSTSTTSTPLRPPTTTSSGISRCRSRCRRTSGPA